MTVDELEELRRLDAVAVTTLKRAEDIRKRVGNAHFFACSSVIPFPS